MNSNDGLINPEKIFPLPAFNGVTYIKPTITRPNIIVGEFSYYSGRDFEKHVTHHYEFNGDRLIIGKFCQIGEGVEFVMNGANHQMNCATTFPFYIFEGWNEYAKPPANADLPLKGDTVVGNDVWIGQNVTVLPGVRIGDGAIIGLNSTVAGDIPPYTVAAGNPAVVIRRRFDVELIELLMRLRWWDKSIGEIKRLLPILTCSDLERVKLEIKCYLEML